MATQEIQTPKLGEPGEQCVMCAAPLATDQRYCLNCGERRAEPRLPFLQLFEQDAAATNSAPPASPPPAAPASTAPSPKQRPDWLTAALLGGGGLALLLVGALIGSAVNDPEINVPQAKAPVVNVGAAPAAAPAAATATAVEFTSDWPGDDGWTVQLQELPKDSTDAAAVAAAKTAAEGQGAAEVGALDADEYPSLDGGAYIIYSGVYTSKKDAQAALKDLKASFPDAKVVEVSSSGDAEGASDDSASAEPSTGNAPKASVSKLKALEKASGDDYVKQSKKLDDTTVIEGTPPKPDNKPAGGGAEAETIG